MLTAGGDEQVSPLLISGRPEVIARMLVATTSVPPRVASSRERDSNWLGETKEDQHAETSKKHFHYQVHFDYEVAPRTGLPQSWYACSDRCRTRSTSPPRVQSLGIKTGNFSEQLRRSGNLNDKRRGPDCRIPDRKKHWKRWGRYLTERAWGTVRED